MDRGMFLVEVLENTDVYSANGSVLLPPTESITFTFLRYEMTSYRRLAILYINIGSYIDTTRISIIIGSSIGIT